MELLNISFLGLGLAADAFAVSLTSGFVIQHIKLHKALKIALFFGVFQGIMPLIGWLLGLSFRGILSSFDHWIAFILLGFIGGKMIYEATKLEEDNKKFNPLDTYTLLALAIATSIDALAAGLGLSFLKYSILLPCTLIGLITFGLSLVGVFIGHKFGGIFNQKIEIIGGLTLIGIGTKILIEDLIKFN
ncbi:manganese efflux pump MntP family protein [Crocosphaera sp. UHCC 0190]|uniref:manganese efflux pump MntP n=1 Tax=Crocosphaera sp. UHCC 0190 TaxID=3110246 RepID=UPI002B217D86|nr:manganese efflux pump MntP family protein [Crocosphaera sp. UHCC 0190]MEA5509585.1 manganese efflux pump MntP family protein [Crocosphaera sp. UHCC 0190]